MSSQPSTYYDQVGREAGVRDLVTTFIDRVYDDVIIGFFFVNIDRPQLIEREIEFASRHLGAVDVDYQGQPIAVVHGKHPINTGHFRRRLWLLENVLGDAGIDHEIIDHWINHNRALLNVVTTGVDCLD